MFDGIRNFDEAFADAPVAPMTARSPHPLRRRKTLRERFVFWCANLVLLPVIGTIYATIIAEGLRRLMPIFQMKIWKLPVPGVGIARHLDGWDRVDLAIVMSILLFTVVTWLWCRIFSEIEEIGAGTSRLINTPIVFGLLAFIATSIIAGDAMIFYIGLSSKSASGWTNTPWYVAPAATLIYSCGLAAMGWWHSDYRTSPTNVV